MRTVLKLTLFLLSANFLFSSPRTDANWPLIHRVGDKLFEGEKEFRFLGMCSSGLNLRKEQISPDWSNRWPDEFEIRSTLDGMRRSGARATRVGIGLSVASPKDAGVQAHIMGRRTYNEDGFRALDLVLALARENDIRIILPLIASQSFTNTRGVDEFAAHSGKTEKGAFWTDEDVKADFRHLVDFVLNRKNTVNGIVYKDDATILAWQLGNEFSSYAGDRKLDYKEYEPKIQAWSTEMSAYLKKVDPRHLIIDSSGYSRHAILEDPNIDIMSSHLYEYWAKVGGYDWVLAPMAKKERAETKGKKPLVIDELGLAHYENLRDLFVAIREEGIAGGLLWGTRGYRRDGGWIYHNEGGTFVNSYHVPGFAAGYEFEEMRTLDLLRKEAYLIRGEPLPPIEKPTGTPALLRAGAGFTWRGAMGSNYYRIERSNSAEGPWELRVTGLHDSVVSDVKKMEANKVYATPVLWHDEYTNPGETYYYRIQGVNVAGETPWSAPLEVKW